MALGEYIGASREAMSAVRQVVAHRDWERLDVAVEFYSESFSRLRHYLERFGVAEADASDLSALRQLDIMHRRVMRQLSWHMRHTEQDLETIGKLLH